MSGIGDRIKARRLELKMSLDELSRQTDIPKSTIYRWETGEIRNMGQAGLFRVAKALDISTDTLLTGETNPTAADKIRRLGREVIFEYYLTKCGYKYDPSICGPAKYYTKGIRLLTLDHDTLKELEQHLISYLDYLFYTYSEEDEEPHVSLAGTFVYDVPPLHKNTDK